MVIQFLYVACFEQLASHDVLLLVGEDVSSSNRENNCMGTAVQMQEGCYCNSFQAVLWMNLRRLVILLLGCATSARLN